MTALTALENRASLRKRLSWFLSRSRGIPLLSDLTPYLPVVQAVREWDFSGFSSTGLTAAALGLKAAVLCKRQAGRASEEDLPRVFALTAEMIRRRFSLEPADCQLAAAAALCRGSLVQMQTGEGKTLTAVFPAVWQALDGKGVHIFTANDYLADRDCRWMQEIYQDWGLDCRAVLSETPPELRKDFYNADVTYLSAREAGFDYLKDRLAIFPRQRLQRPFHFALVDEADHLLIDEARVPLVLAGEELRGTADLKQICRSVETLTPGVHFTPAQEGTRVSLTLEGHDFLEKHLGIQGIHDPGAQGTWSRIHAALHARVLLVRNRDYVTDGDGVHPVDEFTGRRDGGRRWPWGIHEALEVKEGFEPGPSGRILGTITMEHLLDLYPLKAAMTATAESAAQEFHETYGLPTVIIPTRLPDRRTDSPDRFFLTGEQRNEAVLETVMNHHASGRPILIGTASVEESEALSHLLKRKGLSPQVLNALNDREEALIIAQAGRRGALTVATDMAGRGTDIRLAPGGTQEEKDLLRSLGGLLVLGVGLPVTSRKERQLRGRCGRQGDPGESRFFLSLEDPVMVRYGVSDFLPRNWREKADPVTGEIVCPKVIFEVRRAQRLVEGAFSRARRELHRYSGFTERQRKFFLSRREEILLETSGNPEDEAFRLLRLTKADDFWADHLAGIETLMEGLVLQVIGGREPWLEFTRMSAQIFEDGWKEMESAILEIQEQGDKGGSRPPPEALLNQPAGGTWTYQAVLDDSWEFRLPHTRGWLSGFFRKIISP